MNYDLVQTITGIVGLIAILLLWWQIKNELKWKKINFSLDKINHSLIKTNGKIIFGFGIDMKKEVMSDEEFKVLIDEQNFELLFKVQEILDMFENFATLYNMNVFNIYYVYEAYSESTIFYYSKFKRIIDFYREKYDPFYYENIERCVNSFIKKRENEKNNFNRKFKKFEKFKQKTEQKLRRLQNNLIHNTNVPKDKF